jgi:hypothetical protein
MWPVIKSQIHGAAARAAPYQEQSPRHRTSHDAAHYLAQTPGWSRLRHID